MIDINSVGIEKTRAPNSIDRLRLKETMKMFVSRSRFEKEISLLFLSYKADRPNLARRFLFLRYLSNNFFLDLFLETDEFSRFGHIVI